MASQVVTELRGAADAVWLRLSAQLEGMDCYMERAAAPGQWTARQVLCHLLGAPGWRPVPVLASFVPAGGPAGPGALAVVEVKPGEVHLTPERQMMKLQQFKNALARHRREVFDYLATLSDQDLERRACVRRLGPGPDEVTIPAWVASTFVAHWSDHADQLAEIRRVVGLPAADGRAAGS
jgi:hypothetical protein